MAKVNVQLGIKGLTPHRLRGTYATLLSEMGVPVQDIQKIMRHKDIKTTMAYLETNLERVRKAQNDLAQRTGMARRKSGAPFYADPHQTEERVL
jgi:integrase